MKRWKHLPSENNVWSLYRFCEYTKAAFSFLAVRPSLLMFLESKPQHNAHMSRDFGVTIYVKAFLSRVLWRLKWSCIYLKIASTIKRLRAQPSLFFSSIFFLLALSIFPFLFFCWQCAFQAYRAQKNSPSSLFSLKWLQSSLGSFSKLLF